MKCEIPGGFRDLGNLVVSMLQGIKTKARQHIRMNSKQQQAGEPAEVGSEAKEGGLATIKGGHDGCVIWTCAAERQKGRHHGHVSEYSEGQSRRT
jgi:hypothetical protein